MSSRVNCVKSKRQRFYIPFADSHISPHNLRRHALIIRASLFFCSACENSHATYARSSLGNVLITLDIADCTHILSSSISPCSFFSRARFFLSSFSPIDAIDAIDRCYLSPDIGHNFDFRETPVNILNVWRRL